MFLESWSQSWSQRVVAILWIVLILSISGLGSPQEGASSQPVSDVDEVSMVTKFHDRIAPLFGEAGDTYIPGEKLELETTLVISSPTAPVIMYKEERGCWQLMNLEARRDGKPLRESEMSRWVLKTLVVTVQTRNKSLVVTILSQLTIPQDTPVGKYAIRTILDGDRKVLNPAFSRGALTGRIEFVVLAGTSKTFAVGRKYRDAVRAILNGEPGKATPVLEGLLTDASLQDPQRVTIYASIGHAYRSLGDIEKAKKSYRKAIEIWQKSDKSNPGASPNMLFLDLRRLEETTTQP